ncbi:hypothetical protein NL676_039817 [Syzygium grande]|nr:hypothetical protein NL676_039817 [Syzygium grande]
MLTTLLHDDWCTGVKNRDYWGFTGSAYGGQKAVCCTADLATLGDCKQGRIIHRPSLKNVDWPQVFGVLFGIDDQVVTMPTKSIPVTGTGMYNLCFSHCHPNLKELTVERDIILKNPTGYLPGREAPLMKFYGFMSFAFMVLGVLWFSQYARFWREVLPLQNCITLVISPGMFAMALWYFDYAEFNETGIRPIGITVWAVTFGAIKRRVAHPIILMVAVGCGVVRPTLGGITSKVIMLGLTSFLASEILELVENAGAVRDLSGKAGLFFGSSTGSPRCLFSSSWIFSSLSATLS